MGTEGIRLNYANGRTDKGQIWGRHFEACECEGRTNECPEILQALNAQCNPFKIVREYLTTPFHILPPHPPPSPLLKVVTSLCDRMSVCWLVGWYDGLSVMIS